jgi:hypothetical protein
MLAVWPNRGEVTTEDTPYAPLPAFAWGVPHSRLVLDTPGILPVVIHPAMVYEPHGGVFGQFRRRLGWEPKHLDPESEVASIA